MLEKLPGAVGQALRGARAGMDALAFNDAVLASVPESMRLTSPAFDDGAPMGPRYTADGDGVSPPLDWYDVPSRAAGLVLLVEDADAPAPEPLVHAIAWDLPPRDGALADAALPSAGNPGEGHAMGRNSYLKSEYLPPDPPPGHGPHRYAFQLFATAAAPAFDDAPGRDALVDFLRAQAIAKAILTGTYERS